MPKSRKKELKPLDVPIIIRDDGISCVPTCIEMVLNYLREKREMKVPELLFSEICDAIGMDGEGSTLEGVERMNGNCGRVRFATKESGQFDEIRKQLEKENPVIAWIKEYEDTTLRHSVVIKYVDYSKLEVVINDPAFGERKIPVTEFEAIWRKAANILITLVLDKSASVPEAKQSQTEIVQYI